ncbi:rhodanese-like domain-containing protein [Mesorhizobium sp. YR577]|uniref:sulfurtransferase n=1 Tax=Mesorhizobium sp. YR577 TaxID=1884373 RepID=UPI0008EFB856|nr:Rhodanese-like domain-containing protein [Mesorhizobium sp. YR577]
MVIYDRASGVWASRLWWVMRSYGLDQAAVLDDGFAARTTEGRPTTAEPSQKVTAPAFVPRDRPELFVGKSEVRLLVEQGGACLVNALDASDFKATETKSYARPGRIPGSLNVPASSLVDPASGRFLSIPALQQRLSEVLLRPGRKVMYCGGGIAACADALALTLLGEQDVAVYDASLEEWAADPSLPMEVHGA